MAAKYNNTGHHFQAHEPCLTILHYDRGTNSQQFCGSAHHHRGGEACRKYGVCSQFFRLIYHAIEGLLTTLCDELSILMDLAADNIALASHDVFADMARSNSVSAYQAERFYNSFVGDAFGSNHNHCQISTSLYLSVFRSIHRCRSTERKIIARPP